MQTTFYWATVAGAIGFCGGFLGPMILTPEANQGPLLDIFITGPLGFFGGGVLGLRLCLELQTAWNSLTAGGRSIGLVGSRHNWIWRE